MNLGDLSKKDGVLRCPFAMRSSAKLRPHTGHAERSSRGFDANKERRPGAALAAAGGGGAAAGG